MLWCWVIRNEVYFLPPKTPRGEELIEPLTCKKWEWARWGRSSVLGFGYKCVEDSIAAMRCWAVVKLRWLKKEKCEGVGDWQQKGWNKKMFVFPCPYFVLFFLLTVNVTNTLSSYNVSSGYLEFARLYTRCKISELRSNWMHTWTLAILIPRYIDSSFLNDEYRKPFPFFCLHKHYRVIPAEYPRLAAVPIGLHF